MVEDLVTRKWLAEIVSAEETSTQVQVVFTDALEVEGLLELVRARQDGLADPTVDDPARPILLAMSDNGPQMTSGSTREFMALCAIHQHFGRPGTPTDQAWIESLFGHVKAEWPHLNQIRDPATLRAELALVRERYNGVRLHAGIGYVTPNDEHEGRGPPIRKAREPAGAGPPPAACLASRAPSVRTVPGARRCWLIDPGSLSRTQKQVSCARAASRQGTPPRRCGPSRMTAPTASRRTSNGSGGVPPRPGGRGGLRWARRRASQASTWAGSHERGQYDNGTRPPGRLQHLPMVWSRSRLSTPSITLEVRGAVPLIMMCVHWGWPPSHPMSVRSDLRARPNSPAALIPEESADLIRRPGGLVGHLIAADLAPRAKVASRRDLPSA